MPAAPFERVQERGLLTTDVGPRTSVHDEFQVESRTVDIGAQVTGGIGLGHRPLQPSQHRHHLAAHIDERVVRPDRVRRDDGTLDEEVRGGQHQRNVFAGAGFGLIGVDHQVVRLGGRALDPLGDEGPLGAGGKSCAATAAQAGVFDGGDDVVGAHRHGALQRLVAAVAQIGLQ